MEKKSHHLQMIQGTIDRLTASSFLVKGWSVTLSAALFALAAPKSSLAVVYLAYMPAVLFWGLDGYFLWQERLFRELYNEVRKTEEDNIQFSMDTKPFAMKRRWSSAVLSKTLSAFHGTILVSIIVVAAILDRGGR